MFSIRKKLLLGQVITLLVISTAGFMVMSQIKYLGDAIDVILRENYSSVKASQEMSRAIDSIDRNTIYAISGFSPENKISNSIKEFENALTTEMEILTLPGEKEKAQSIDALFDDYKAVIIKIDNNQSVEQKYKIYFNSLLPISEKIHKFSDEISVMNQENMISAKIFASDLATKAHRRILIAIAAVAAILVLFGYLIAKWVLRPVDMLIESANEIRNGNLNLVIESKNKDEIGKLSTTFNEMAASLREMRQSDMLNVLRTKKTTEEIFKALPVSIAVLDLDGRIEFATELAMEYFGMTKGVYLKTLGYDNLHELLRESTDLATIINVNEKEGFIQRFINNKEHFFSASAVPIMMNAEKPFGSAIILEDVTNLIEQKELKRSVVSTVSHQLRTPLTSLRMSMYLLLEEKIGTLNGKQIELILAARDDSERVAGILDDLLDLNKIESGKTMITVTALDPKNLAEENIEYVASIAKERGVTIQNKVSENIPQVMADKNKMTHVFSNLLSNALRFTEPGGKIEITAEEESQDNIIFHITDTGKGISTEDLPHVFDLFYRGSGQDLKSGIGLGLTIVKEIVSAHGGNVYVKSEPGKGTVFSFTLKKLEEL